MSGVTLFFMVLALSVPAASADLGGGAIGAGEPGQLPSAVDTQQPAIGAVVQSGSRGQMLYENHCLGCHESLVFIREKRTVRNLAGLRDAVLRWAVEEKLPWSAEELDDVAGHLNRTYYRFGAR